MTYNIFFSKFSLFSNATLSIFSNITMLQITVPEICQLTKSNPQIDMLKKLVFPSKGNKS